MEDKEQRIYNVVKAYKELMENKPLVIQAILDCPKPKTNSPLADYYDYMDTVGFYLEMCQELWRYIEETDYPMTKKEWYEKFWDFVSGQLEQKEDTGI